MKKRTGRVIDAAVTAAKGEFLEIPSFICHINEDPVADTEGLCVCGGPLTELGCLDHENDPESDTGIILSTSEVAALEDI